MRDTSHRCIVFFFFNDTATTEIYTLSLHDALPISVKTKINVHVPYPDKFLEGEINVVEGGEGNKALFLVPIINRGKLDIVNAKAIIDIYTPLNEKIVSLESESISLNSLKREQLSLEWNANVNPGRYLALGTVVYDNNILNLEKEFNVGELILEIQEIVVKDFELGGIAKFSALVENKWSDDLKDVYLNILVYNDEGETMADFKSPTYDIDSLSKSDMVAYWDTGEIGRAHV